jgi:hypothetical protein
LEEFGREVAGRIVVFAFAVGKLGEHLGFFERLFTRGLAFGPQSTELSHIFLDGAVDALLIEGQKLEVFALGEPGAGLGDGFVDGELGGVVPGGGGECAECALLAESEDAGLDGASAFQPPVVFGDGLREFDLQGADR